MYVCEFESEHRGDVYLRFSCGFDDRSQYLKGFIFCLFVSFCKGVVELNKTRGWNVKISFRVGVGFFSNGGKTREDTSMGFLRKGNLVFRV